MGLEAATYIDGLVATNPIGASDPKSQGDDHLRLLKAVLKASFPTVNAAVTATVAQLNALNGGTLAAANGSNLTNLNATALATGTVADARLSANVPLLNASNSFSGTTNTFGTTIIGQNPLSALPSSLNNPRLYRTTTGFPGIGAGGLVLQARSDVAAGEIGLIAGQAGSETMVALFRQSLIALAATSITLNGVAASDFARLSVDNTLEGILTLSRSAPLIIFSETGVAANNGKWRMFADTEAFHLSAINDALDSEQYPLKIERTGTTIDSIALAATTLSLTGALSTPNASAAEVGFKGVPYTVLVDNYTLVLSDAGKAFNMNAASKTLTIPANASVAFPVGTVITFEAGETTSIAITSDVLYLAGTSYATTGTRTLARGGIATALKRTSTSWIISGTGLS